ncbi:hypothetical protein QSE00_24980 [Arenibacter sp. M-2]|uniref:hypothetical protein n=1 Tax=Arenibacter sp. M-2 TaxID=3053612 RepID=UPI0025701751|nr:hypothetical protein [Arenibacter sp. M-2]MDL5515088.1 hypothetical protein [Arenibacter sp. M-2]
MSLNIIYKILTELEFVDDSNEVLRQWKKENNLGEDLKLIEQGLEFETIQDIQVIDGQLYKRMNYSSVSKNSVLVEDFRQDFTKAFLEEDRVDIKSFKVRSIKYSSPGFADLMGAGKIVEQIFDMFKHYFPNKETKLKNSLLEQDIISKRIENLKNLGFSKQELQKFLDVRNSSILNIKNLKLSDKITKVEVKEIE